MTEQEARLEILKERQRMHGKDAATDALIAKLTRPQGRDAYIARLEHMMDSEPEEPDDDPEPEEQHDDSEPDDQRAAADAGTLGGRDLWLQRLPHLCEVSK